jgi:hypothetical protein
LVVLVGFIGILGNSLGSAVGLLPLYFKPGPRVWSAGVRGFALGTLAAEVLLLGIVFLGLPDPITLPLLVLPAVGGAVSIRRAQQ